MTAVFADAIALAEHFAGDHQVAAILDDNIIEGTIRRSTAYASRTGGTRAQMRSIHQRIDKLSEETPYTQVPTQTARMVTSP